MFLKHTVGTFIKVRCSLHGYVVSDTCNWDGFLLGVYEDMVIFNK